jgi:hypothetical protein
MKKIIAVVVMVGLIVFGCGISQARKYQFYWERTKAALDAITTAIHGDVGMVITSDNASDNTTTFYHYDGSSWVVAQIAGTASSSTPSRTSAGTISTIYGDNDTVVLGKPSGFMDVPVGGTTRKVPYY